MIINLLTRLGIREDILRLNGQKYMTRYHLTPKWKSFTIYIHVWYSSDDEWLHDHPAASWGRVLRGRLMEETTTPKFEMRENNRKSGWVYRSAEFRHRIIVLPNQKPPITLFIFGRRVRDWGFIKNGKWIPHKEFIAQYHGK